MNGVMHATYHATGDRILRVNGTTHLPSYVDVERDMVTWGGEPQTVVPDRKQPIYALINRMDGQTTYKLDYEIMGRDMTWPKVTEPGESGSPIVMETDGELQLVTLAGNHVTHAGKATEFGTVDDMRTEAPPMAPATVHLITAAPGSGKTFRTIPEICKSFLKSDLKDKRKNVIIVSGPTRVVCHEIFQALVAQLGPENVGCMVKNKTIKGKRVMVMAHATLASLMLLEDQIMSRLGGLIIDESHVDDRATEVMKIYAQCMTKTGLTSWFLSATHPGSISDGSNYAIVDKKIRETKVQATIEMLLEEGKRILLFCPSIRGKNGTEEMAEYFRDYKPVVLNSSTYESQKVRLKDDNNKLIISTNIAECGMNTELDAVVDFSKNFYFIENAGVIEGTMAVITEASRVQRRGRVGRINITIHYSRLFIHLD